MTIAIATENHEVSEPAKPESAAKPVYFYKLNQMRMIGAILVFVTHVELWKRIVHAPHHLNIIEVLKYGHQGLNFFFVLSGFLITYLMLREHRESGSVNIRNFYMRRILRVWPLYYVIVALAFLAGPHLDMNLHVKIFDSWRDGLYQHFWQELSLFLAVLPNLANCIFQPMTCGCQCWSVGVEEQFYVIWPLLFWALRKKPWLMMPLSIFAKVAALSALGVLDGSSLANDARLHDIFTTSTNFIKHFDIEGLAVGAFAAYLLVAKPRVVQLLSHPIGRLGMVIPILIAIPFMPQLGRGSLTVNAGIIDFGFADLIFAIAFGWACIVLATSSGKPKTLLGKWMNYGGTITYGFYMYHLFAIMVFLQLLAKMPDLSSDPVTYNLVLYGGAFTLSMLVSAASYEWYEKKIQSLKRYFSYVRKSSASEEISTAEPVFATAQS